MSAQLSSVLATKVALNELVTKDRGKFKVVVLSDHQPDKLKFAVLTEENRSAMKLRRSSGLIEVHESGAQQRMDGLVGLLTLYRAVCHTLACTTREKVCLYDAGRTNALQRCLGIHEATHFAE
jgi:hypothetical protein